MKGTIAAVAVTALCTTGVCFVAFRGAPAAGAQTVDGTTEESFKRSIDLVKQAMPKTRQQEFEEAMTLLSGVVMLPAKDGNPLASIMALSADPGAASRRLRSRVHGLTGNDVIAAGDAAFVEMKGRGANANGLAALASGGLAGAIVSGELAQARRNANESAAIATLKNISSAQSQCQASGVIDANANGAGEYGFFGELSGRTRVHGGQERISPPVLSTAFGSVSGGQVMRSGYVFQIFLPDARGNGLAEAPTGGSESVDVDPGQAETLWCCYAWPQTPGSSGQRAFFINQGGDVLASSNESQQYSADKGPTPTAAFAPSGDATIASAVAANAVGSDGNRWVVVN